VASALTKRLREQVEEILDGLRPALVADGGGVELVEVDEDGTVQVSMLGACASCPAQLATIRLALEASLLAEVPGVTAVVPVAGSDLAAASD
jgi:Fe-S cluster biogenesis protein NfuA